MQPDTSSAPPIKLKKLPQQRHFLAAFFITLLWGLYGADRMYLGKWGSGLIKLLTLGGVGVWLVVDLAALLKGATRDAWGRELVGYEEYKGFANRILWVYALVILAVFVISVAVVSYVITSYAGGLLPDFTTLWNGGLSPELRSELGL